MAGFWTWCIRWPAYALAAASVVLTRADAFDASFGWALAALLGFVGYIAGFATADARARAARKRALAQPQPLNVIPGLKPQRGRMDRAA